VVARRGWMDRGHFLDLVGATNLIPGPNSTELVLHVGYERRGPLGLVVAGLAFILPAVLITGSLAWAYVEFGTLPAVAPFLVGIKPAVLAVILGAVWRLGRRAVKGVKLAVLGLAVLAASLAGTPEVLTLLGGGLVGMLLLRAPSQPPAALPALAIGRGTLPLGAAAAGTAAALSTWKLGLFFLKVGAVLYGSGYVLVAFLEGDLVQRYGWLSEGQLLDAIAIGQLTPGPVLSTATFIGYVLDGGIGAVVATVAIFLPSFVFVLLLNPLVPHLRRSPWTAAFLDAVNVSAIALMLAVTFDLARTSLTDWRGWTVALLAAVAALRFRVSVVALILGGALLGYLLRLVG